MTFHCVRWQDRQKIATLLVANGWTRPYALDPNAGFTNRNTFTRGRFHVYMESDRSIMVKETLNGAPEDWSRTVGTVMAHKGHGWRERIVAAIESLCANRVEPAL